LEALAEPGGICISGTVRDHIGDRLELDFDDLGDQNLKNIARPVRVFQIRLTTAEHMLKAAPIEGSPKCERPHGFFSAVSVTAASPERSETRFV
jgi:hypothetical protein